VARPSVDYIHLENNTYVSSALQIKKQRNSVMDLSTLSTSVALSLISDYLTNGNSSTQHTSIKKKDDLLKPHVLWKQINFDKTVFGTISCA